MPIKYAHAKKRALNAPLSKSKKQPKAGGTFSSGAVFVGGTSAASAHRNPNPHLDRTISQAMSAVSELERAISRILLLRYEQDICRLYSTRLHNIATQYLPKLILDCTEVANSPGWVANNANSEEFKDFFRAAIAMDLRQAGERVATKSVLWSYTALRHFAMSNNIPICQKRGLHSLRLLPHFASLRLHLDSLESLPSPTFARQPLLAHNHTTQALSKLEKDIARRRSSDSSPNPAWDNWRTKISHSYSSLLGTLWNTANEFDVRGYGLILREKLTSKWCDCGCSTDHLGEVCERTVREEEEESGVRPGKEKEWDGRGSGVCGWQSCDEEDVWEVELDFGAGEVNSGSAGGEEDIEPELTIGELMEWRYFKAERAKELGNNAFRKADYETAISHYTLAFEIEPEMPHYQLNLAAAHLKLSNWIAAEKACNVALSQHRSGKGYWRRAKARKMLGRPLEAMKDLRALLGVQPMNLEAMAELETYAPKNGPGSSNSGLGSFDSSHEPSSSSSSVRVPPIRNRNGHDPTGGRRSLDIPPFIGPSSPQQIPNAAPSSSSSRIYTNGLSHPHTNGSASSSLPTPSTSNPNTHLDHAAGSRNGTAQGGQPTVTFTPSDEDKRRLRITTMPLQVEMPIIPPTSPTGDTLDGKENVKAPEANAKSSPKRKIPNRPNDVKSNSNTGKNVTAKANGKHDTSQAPATAKTKPVNNATIPATLYDTRIETYSYPTWDRFKVTRVFF